MRVSTSGSDAYRRAGQSSLPADSRIRIIESPKESNFCGKIVLLRNLANILCCKIKNYKKFPFFENLGKSI
jgi:hypothetical protein